VKARVGQNGGKWLSILSEEWKTLFSGIDLGKRPAFHGPSKKRARQSTLGHVPGPVENHGGDWTKVCGHTAERTSQRNIIRAKKGVHFSPRPPHLRWGWWFDTIELDQMLHSRFTPISISGYHILRQSRRRCRSLAFSPSTTGWRYVEVWGALRPGSAS